MRLQLIEVDFFQMRIKPLVKFGFIWVFSIIMRWTIDGIDKEVFYENEQEKFNDRNTG